MLLFHPPTIVKVLGVVGLSFCFLASLQKMQNRSKLSILRRKDPNLWVQALSFFSSRRECKGQIPEVLQHIDEDQLMPPLMVIQTLADSQFSTLSDIKVFNCIHIPLKLWLALL